MADFVFVRARYSDQDPCTIKEFAINLENIQYVGFNKSDKYMWAEIHSGNGVSLIVTNKESVKRLRKKMREPNA